MPAPIPCDLCGAGEATFLVTVRQNGDTLGLCVGCVPAWAEAIVSTLDAAATDDRPRITITAPAPVAGPEASEMSDEDWEASAGFRGSDGAKEAEAEGSADVGEVVESQATADEPG